MMKSVIAFAAGVLLGSGATYILLKEHFDNKSQEEIDSVIQAFRGDEPEPEPENEPEPIPFTETSSIDNMREEYKVNFVNYRTTVPSEAKTKEEEMKERARSIPHVVSQSEVNHDEYDDCELIYYADGTLADPKDNVITDIRSMVGDALEHFHDNIEDGESVFVSDDRLKICYEIVRDSRTYKEVVGVDPPGKGGD